MIKYKLTNQDMTTFGGCRWTVGVKKKTSGIGKLCGPGWLHCYDSPLLAVLLNQIHVNFTNPRLFECKTCGRGKHDNGLKSGHKSMTLIKELQVPAITITQKVAFAILCAKKVHDDWKWNEWADRWLSGEDRSIMSAADAAIAAYATDVVDAAAYAAHAATYAGRTAEFDIINTAKKAMKY